MMLNILVTAVGCELAFAVIKAIRLIREPYRLIGCDIYREVVGKYWCDKFYNVPLAIDEVNYIKSLKNIVRENEINVIIPTADAEFFVLAKYKEHFKKELNCDILINDYEEIERFNDKWLAYQWYMGKELPAPETFLAADPNLLNNELLEARYPMIIKPRIGGGARNIYRINSYDDIMKYLDAVPSPIIQEYLLPDELEYTAGTYRTISNNVMVLIMKRTLKFGMTNTAEVIYDSELEEFCKKIILNTNLVGSNNIQFRVTSDGPKILEINPRFSGTAGIRANFGFNDVEMWIDETIFNKEIEPPEVKRGFVLRYMEELYRFN